MAMKKIISALLTVLMLVSVFTVFTSAAEVADDFVPEYNTNLSTPTINYLTGSVDFGGSDAGALVIANAKDKIATMDCRLEKDGYRLYVDAYSGEVGVENIETGEILLSNPYDLSQSTTLSKSLKMELMSQIIVTYKDITKNQSQTYYSADWSIGKAFDKGGSPLSTDPSSGEALVEPSQIRVRNIKNGLRVEYTIGPEQSKMLVPRVIEKSAFETKLLNPIREAVEAAKAEWIEQYIAEDYTPEQAASRAEERATLYLGPMENFYKLYDAEAVVDEIAQEYYTTLPITKKMAVYALDATLSTKIRARIEQIIKTYAPSYTFEEMDADHLKVEYVDKDQMPPLFKMALEYTLDEKGLSVRLPANGIRYTESLYELLSVEILPYLGATSGGNKGYTFFPDGSGALFDYQQIAADGNDVTVASKVYGQDFAYHTITGAHQETVRYPVFGMTSTEILTELDADGKPVLDEELSTPAKPVYKTYEKERGFVAIVEEGDAMMELVAAHEVTTTGYNTVKMRVDPRPRDTYNVADAISVGQNTEWTVVSSRKYTGSYKIRYMMLTPEETAKANDWKNTYDTSYVGMAMAYRNYLEAQGILTRLTAEDVKAGIPLYIETFGAMQTTKRFLSIPYETMSPLTTFADIYAMYNDLSKEDVGITNVNFILTGYTKGGLTSPTVPYNLKWDGAVEQGDMNFEELTAIAKEKGFGLFPDFDFAFVQRDTMFDGLSLKEHAVKTIDDRYTSKREYSATKQTYISYFELALSPAYFNHFYTKLTENFLEYNPIGISVATLGSYLNSDFDEDEPYNRADAKSFTVQAFAYLRENYNKVMTTGGNAYTWKYVDYITDVALDSSRYSAAAASVPFLGIVLHGYVEFAGSPINMEGNIDYAILKTIESGAGLQFILSYRDTENLKESEILSKYYSIKYKNWKDDMIALYSEVNDVLKNVQTSVIVDHYFLNGVRVPDNDELEADAKAILEALIEKETLALEQYEKEQNFRILTARKLLDGSILEMNQAMTLTGGDTTVADVSEMVAAAYRTFSIALTAQKTLADVEETYAAEKAILDAMAETDPNYAAQQEKVTNIAATLEAAVIAATAAGDLDTALKGVYLSMDSVLDVLRGYTNNYIIAKEGLAIMKERGDYATKLDAMEANLNAVSAMYTTLLGEEQRLMGIVEGAYNEYKAFLPESEEILPYVYKGDQIDDSAKEDVQSVPKYESDANKIAYVKYENGTAFILNFNNYAVVVTDPNTGITYTIETYGYVYLKPNA